MELLRVVQMVQRSAATLAAWLDSSTAVQWVPNLVAWKAGYSVDTLVVRWAAWRVSWRVGRWDLTMAASKVDTSVVSKVSSTVPK